KDHLFNEAKVMALGQEILHNYPAFELELFIRNVVDRFPALELKERITWISSNLRQFLPPNFREATSIIIAALPDPLDETKSDNDFGDFIHAPYSEFVARYGCTSEDLFFSLEALKEITKRFSAEYAIRKFINAFPTTTMEVIKGWCYDDNYHVRRLCSEGTRAKLPWGQKIDIHPLSTLEILDILHADNTRFVTRSVANHLNDLAKSHPQDIIDRLEKWMNVQKQSPSEIQFIVKHSLRNLVKDGHPRALSMLGVSDARGVIIQNLQYPSDTAIGSVLKFSFDVHSTSSKRIMIDYIVYFRNKQGLMNRKKIHKLQSFDIEQNKSIAIHKKHPLRANMTTRQLYPGTHKVEIQVNGEILASFHFELREH
ncbi:MAG TPA: DNA alkylation repair protein, partial [Saprospiraceae bacterium]|nr:DNA alkylation repair protein [Saprospiraceae bacterium]